MNLSVRKSFQFRIYPTKSQLRKMESTLEGCRYVFNQTLALRKDAWEKDKENITLYECNSQLTIWKDFKEDLYDIHSQVLQNAQQRVDLAFKAFFRRCKAGENPGYPRFKGKGRYDSFTFPQSGFKLKGSKLTLSKIGDIKIINHREIEGKIKTLTIRKTSTGKWFACFSCEIEKDVVTQPIDNSIGIDLGLSTFATFSNGESIPRQRFFKEYEKKLAKASRKRELQEKGSKARSKAKLVESKIHERVANLRKDFAHKHSLKLVRSFDLICLEDLSIKSMQEGDKKNIRKGIADVAWNQFIQFTQYKAASAGKRVILVNPKNTTKECSRCGCIVPKELSERTHSCSCGLVLDRDLNAAINILRRGLASLAKA